MLDPREIVRQTILRRLQTASFEQLVLVANLLDQERPAPPTARVQKVHNALDHRQKQRGGRRGRIVVRLGPDSLSHAIKTVVDHVTNGGDGQNSTKIARATGLKSSDTQRALAEAIKAGILKKRGERRGTVYFPA